jgi:hypothetical protein
VKTLHKGGGIMLFQKVCKLAVIITVSLLTLTGIAVAEDFDIDKNSILKGTYLFSGNVYCVVAYGGEFNEDLTLPNGGATFSTVVQGEYIFNGEGRGTSFRNWLVITNNNLGPGQRPLNSGTTEADFYYKVNMDGTFEMTSEEARVVRDFGFPQQTIDGFGTSTGAIAAGHKTFTIADTNPTIETIHRGSKNIERICNRTGIGIKIQ